MCGLELSIFVLPVWVAGVKDDHAAVDSNCELEDTNRAEFGKQDTFDSDEEFIPSFGKNEKKKKTPKAQKKAIYICNKKVYNTNKTTKISYKTRELTNPFIEDDDEMRLAENKIIVAAGNSHLF